VGKHNEKTRSVSGKSQGCDKKINKGKKEKEEKRASEEERKKKKKKEEAMTE